MLVISVSVSQQLGGLDLYLGGLDFYLGGLDHVRGLTVAIYLDLPNAPPPP